MAKLEQIDISSWAIDRPCIIIGLVLLAAWVHSAHELSFLLGLVIFTLGCGLRSRWRTEQMKDEFDDL
jgi:hypothetical protein